MLAPAESLCNRVSWGIIHVAPSHVFGRIWPRGRKNQTEEGFGKISEKEERCQAITIRIQRSYLNFLDNCGEGWDTPHRATGAAGLERRYPGEPLDFLARMKEPPRTGGSFILWA